MNLKALLQLACVAVILFQAIVTYQPGPVVPPGPKPPVIDPDVPVIVEGDRWVVIIRESENDTAAFNQMTIGLRSGANAEYLASEGHTLLILDDDAVDQDGQPVELVQTLLPLNPTLPALFILEASDKRPLHYETLSATATAADVIQTLKQHGG